MLSKSLRKKIYIFISLLLTGLTTYIDFENIDYGNALFFVSGLIMGFSGKTMISKELTEDDKKEIKKQTEEIESIIEDIENKK